MSNVSFRFSLPTLGAILYVPICAVAHIGVGHVSSFGAGFGHPVSGMDHVLAMVAVGLWAAQMGGRAVWIVPLAFVSLMGVGGVLGILEISIPFGEQGIVTSVFVLGVLIAASLKLPVVVSAFVVGIFALFHGHAHGTEMPAGLGGLEYGAGFALATALLHMTGIALRVALKKLRLHDMAVRFAGAVIAVGGVYLVIP